MRIVHCVRAPIGGIFRHVVDLATAQTAAGHAVGIVCDSLTGGAFEEQWIADVGPRFAHGIARFPMRRALSPSDLVATARLWSHISAIDPDVLHGHGSKGGSFARLIGTAMRLKGRRPIRIYCPHGGSLHFDATTLEGRIYFGLERILERMTDGLVFVSDYERRSYVAKIGRPRVASVLAHNGLRQDEFDPIVPRPDAVDFLYIGMLRALKGTDIFIRAVERLMRRGIPVRAAIVGVGDERGAYEAMVRDLGLRDHVTFHDPVPIRQALPGTRAVVLPSRAESFPYVVLETLAAGVPLIATRVGGIPEIYREHADRLVPPDDVDAFAAALERHLADPAAGLALAAEMRCAVAARFSIEAMMHAVMALYERLRDPAVAESTPMLDAAGVPEPARCDRGIRPRPPRN